MKKIKQKVLCIGSMGKDVFFPIASGNVIDTSAQMKNEKQLCFGYGTKVHIEDRFNALGGCACNVSIGLSRLGIDVYALGNVGKDCDRKWIVTTLEQEGVDVTKVRTIENANTDLSIIIVDTNTGERTIFVNRDVGESLAVHAQDIKGFEWCFVGSLYGDDIEKNMKVIHDAIINDGLKLVYNPGGKNISQDKDVVSDLIHHAYMIFVNKSEAREIVSKFDLLYNEKDLLNEEYLMSVLKEHMHDQAGIVVLTDGLRGAWGYDGENIYHTDTIDKPVHDATGAGDAFASGFFAAVLYELPLEQCMQWGSINSDTVIDYYGSQEGLQKHDTIQDGLVKFPVENKK